MVDSTVSQGKRPMELGKGQLEYTATHTSHVGLHKADQDSLEKSLKWEMVFSIEKLKIKNKTTPPPQTRRQSCCAGNEQV